MCIGWIKQKFSIEIEQPSEFAEPLSVIRTKLTTKDAQLAAELLQHGRDLYVRLTETSESVERRATTLIGTVAIAASLATAGGSILVAATAANAGLWTAGISLAFLALILALVLTAVYSFGAIRVQRWTYPKPADVFERVQSPKIERDLDLAADLYYSFGRNDPIARNQVAYLKASGRWLCVALSLVVVLAAVLVAHSAFASENTTKLGCSVVRPLDARVGPVRLSCHLKP